MNKLPITAILGRKHNATVKYTCLGANWSCVDDINASASGNRFQFFTMRFRFLHTGPLKLGFLENLSSLMSSALGPSHFLSLCIRGKGCGQVSYYESRLMFLPLTNEFVLPVGWQPTLLGNTSLRSKGKNTVGTCLNVLTYLCIVLLSVKVPVYQGWAVDWPPTDLQNGLTTGNVVSICRANCYPLHPIDKNQNGWCVKSGRSQAGQAWLQGQ